MVAHQACCTQQQLLLSAPQQCIRLQSRCKRSRRSICSGIRALSEYWSLGRDLTRELAKGSWTESFGISSRPVLVHVFGIEASERATGCNVWICRMGMQHGQTTLFAQALL